MTIRIYRGADGDYSLYEDDGESLGYLKGDAVLTRFQWNDSAATLKIQRTKLKSSAKVPGVRNLRIELIPDGASKTLDYTGKPITINLRQGT